MVVCRKIWGEKRRMAVFGIGGVSVFPAAGLSRLLGGRIKHNQSFGERGWVIVHAGT